MEAETGTVPDTSRDSEVERLTRERDELRERLVEAEQRLAELPALRVAKAELNLIRSSPSWKVTMPMRRGKAALQRELLPKVRLAVKRSLLEFGRRLRD